MVVVGCAEMGGRGGGGVGDAVPELVPDACRWGVLGGGFRCVEDISNNSPSASSSSFKSFQDFKRNCLGYHQMKIIGNNARGDYIINSA